MTTFIMSMAMFRGLYSIRSQSREESITVVTVVAILRFGTPHFLKQNILWGH